MEALRRESPDVDSALAYCKAFNVAVQAGGNIGVWPLRLGSRFQTVYTFEPDAQNFSALAWNTRERENIIRMQAALGDRHAMVGLNRTPENIGAHTINPTGGIVPMMTIDSLVLPACNLIYLDIEGYEPQALFGARKTLARFKPVIGIEDKGLSDKDQRDEAIGMLIRMGYHLAEELHRDKIFVW